MIETTKTPQLLVRTTQATSTTTTPVLQCLMTANATQTNDEQQQVSSVLINNLDPIQPLQAHPEDDRVSTQIATFHNECFILYCLCSHSVA